MPWLTCTRCGWYQSLGKFCASCASPMPSSAGRRPGRQNTRAPAPGASSPAKPAGPVTPELLQQRWDAARRSAQQPGHTKVELICSACHSRTFNHKSECKACKLPLATAYTLLPCQWPPLGVPASVMQRHEPGAAAAPEPPAQTVHKPAPAHTAASPPANTSLDHLTVGQLRAEIGQMEKFVKDCEIKTSPPCVLMQQTLVSYRQALAGRKSVGLRLDAAAQKHAAATKAREVAEAQLSEIPPVLLGIPWPALRGPLRNHFWEKRPPQPYWGGDNSGNALEASNALNYRVWGIPAVLSTGIPEKALRAFPVSFRNFSGISSGKSQPYWGCGLSYAQLSVRWPRRSKPWPRRAWRNQRRNRLTTTFGSVSRMRPRQRPCHQMCQLQSSTPWQDLAFSPATWRHSLSSWAMSSRMALCRSRQTPTITNPPPPGDVSMEGAPGDQDGADGPAKCPLHWPCPAQRGGPAQRTATQSHAGHPGGNAPAGAQPTQTSERGWLGRRVPSALGGCVASCLLHFTGPAPAAWQRPCAALVWCLSTSVSTGLCFVGCSVAFRCFFLSWKWCFYKLWKTAC